jgi:thymidine kinase
MAGSKPIDNDFADSPPLYDMVTQTKNKMEVADINGRAGGCRIRFGPMFSGKTTALINDLAQYADLGSKVLLINSKKDNRQTEAQDETVTTHNSQFKGLSDKVDRVKLTSLKEIYESTNEINIDKYDVIGIDEGQFYADLKKMVTEWVLKLKKYVIISSLDGDSNLRPFGQAHELICLCSDWGGKKAIEKLSAKCINCSMKNTNCSPRFEWVPAGFTRCLKSKTQTILAGGEDLYQAVCLSCHQENSSIV